MNNQKLVHILIGHVLFNLLNATDFIEVLLSRK